MSGERGRQLVAGLLFIGLLGAPAGPASAQIQMPDVREMSGMPLPTSDLPTGTVTVRLVRGALSNNIADHPVELREADRVLTVRTDETGRARFSGLRPGATVSASATVDGERLESQRFPMPDGGGVRLMLVATPAGEVDAHALPAERAGRLVLGPQSRFVIEMNDAAVEVFYLLEILNTAPEPIDAGPLVFDMPTGARSTTVLQGSTPSAVASGSRVTVTAPFPPGRTVLQTGYHLPYQGGRLDLAQTLPAPLEQVAVVVEKAGRTRLASAQLVHQQEMSADGREYIVASGPGIPAGGTLALSLDGLPHHSTWPRTVALALAGLIAAGGAWGAFSSRRPQPDARRRRLQARRDRLFADLVRLEERKRAGRVDERGYGRRRRELVAELERIYVELDEGLAA